MKMLIVLHTDTLKDSLLGDSIFLGLLALISVCLIILLYKYLKK